MGKNGAKETYSYSKRDLFIQQKRPKRHASRKHGKNGARTSRKNETQRRRLVHAVESARKSTEGA